MDQFDTQVSGSLKDQGLKTSIGSLPSIFSLQTGMEGSAAADRSTGNGLTISECLLGHCRKPRIGVTEEPWVTVGGYWRSHKSLHLVKCSLHIGIGWFCKPCIPLQR